MNDASNEFSNSDDENDDAIEDTEDDYDVWENINDKLDDENVSGLAKTNRVLELVLYDMKRGFVWHHESLYKAIMVKAREARINKDLLFQEALNYAIRQNKFEILKKLASWRHESLYKAIMVKARKVRINKDMSFQEALKYAIRQKKFEILKKTCHTQI